MDLAELGNPPSIVDHLLTSIAILHLPAILHTYSRIGKTFDSNLLSPSVSSALVPDQRVRNWCLGHSTWTYFPTCYSFPVSTC
jgi:hypothetical protein